jgi:hypothetical protein
MDGTRMEPALKPTPKQVYPDHCNLQGDIAICNAQGRESCNLQCLAQVLEKMAEIDARANAGFLSALAGLAEGLAVAASARSMKGA